MGNTMNWEALFITVSEWHKKGFCLLDLNLKKDRGKGILKKLKQ